MTADDGPELGIVVPTLNEAAHLPRLLEDLERLDVDHRIVVADGGSEDGTRSLARSRGLRVVRAPRGRASQLNAGARVLDTRWLLFLHADVRIPPETRSAIVEWLSTAEGADVAHFAFRLAGDDWFWRFIELGQALRERISGLAYGDQGLLVSRSTFRLVGGYPDQPLMEDVEILRRLRQRARIESLDAPLIASPRRYRREGRWSAWLRNTALILLYTTGVPAERLVRWYRPEPASSPGSRSGRTLLVFAKSPEPGRVKTRLARVMGPARAAELYRRMGRRVVDQLRGGDYRIVVCFDPPDAERAVRRWLGADSLSFRPQSPGDLGERMVRAFEGAFRRAEEVCVVGTDAPSVDRTVISRAFRELERVDVVLGPARDGGYYLMALKRPIPALFRDVPWSTDAVLEVTLERARELGLAVAQLEERSDVDTVEDLGPDTVGLADRASGA